jgi:hypothetical protein
LTRNCPSNRVIDSLALNKDPSGSTHLLLAHSYLSTQKPRVSVGFSRDAILATVASNTLTSPAMLLYYSVHLDLVIQESHLLIDRTGLILRIPGPAKCPAWE